MAGGRSTGSYGHIVEDQRFAAVEQELENVNYESHGLIEVLITAQESFGCLTEELLVAIAKKLRVPLSRVWGVVTFYDRFKVETATKVECCICTGPVCSTAGAGKVLEKVCQHARVVGPGQSSPDHQYHIEETGCLGLCDQAPAALVNDQPQVKISIEDVPALLRGEAQTSTIHVTGAPQVLTAPINRLAPTDLEAHLAEGAFTALEMALLDLSPEEIILDLKESRLTGRGGAGFLTGLKWQLARQASETPKYAICNFDESEPGTFKDRVLMEGNPFRVIEGLILCGYVTGIHQGYIYIRNEYHKANDIVVEAIEKLYTAGLVGEHILDTDFSFDIEVRHNAGAYICGEETALIESMEGKRGHPRIKPPYPTRAGLFDHPTTINNVETLAVIPELILHGGEWFRQWGTDRSVGLRLFCLSGDVNQPGVVEAPYGTSVHELIVRFGGGFRGEPQAILIGGASGGFINPDQIDVALTHEDLKRLDVPIGSGAIMVFNQSVDMWMVLERLAGFFTRETCGQCVPCRLGTREILTRIQELKHGRGTFADLRKLESICQMMEKTCICGLGLTAALPMRSFLTNIESFEHSYV